MSNFSVATRGKHNVSMRERGDVGFQHNWDEYDMRGVGEWFSWCRTAIIILDINSERIQLESTRRDISLRAIKHHNKLTSANWDYRVHRTIIPRRRRRREEKIKRKRKLVFPPLSIFRPQHFSPTPLVINSDFLSFFLFQSSSITSSTASATSSDHKPNII